MLHVVPVRSGGVDSCLYLSVFNHLKRFSQSIDTADFGSVLFADLLVCRANRICGSFTFQIIKRVNIVVVGPCN